MSSTKAATERISVNRQYRTEALKPGGAVLSVNFLMVGGPRYGTTLAVANVLRSGVKPPGPGDDIGGDLPVMGMYAFLGGKQGESVNVTFDSIPTVFGAQTISGQMNLAADLKTGHATFTYSSKGDHSLTTVENVKVTLAKTESYKD
jgi:hypothetical protein